MSYQTTELPKGEDLELALSQSLVSTFPAMAFKSCSRNSRLPVARIRRSMNWVRRSTKALDFVLPFLTGTCRNSSCYGTKTTHGIVSQNIKFLSSRGMFFSSGMHEFTTISYTNLWTEIQFQSTTKTKYNKKDTNSQTK